MIISFLGVILVSNGSYLILLIDPEFSESSSSFDYVTKDPIVMIKAGSIMALTMVAHAFAVVMTKKLKNTNTI
jgi:hypothetical protein